MKKVLIAKDLKGLFKEKDTFLDREDIIVFTAATNDDVLNIHSKEKVNLIVTQLDMPGIKSEELFDVIRNSKEMKGVSSIIICRGTLAHRERCKQCGANAVFNIPVDTALLSIKMQQLLTVAPRKSYRVALAVAFEGKFRNKPLPFWTENISASGMLIRAEEALSKDDLVFFSFFLPDGTHASGYGEIARVIQLAEEPNAFFYGIRFTDIDPSVKSAIETAVNKEL